jgi:uncharacterized membrane protein
MRHGAVNARIVKVVSAVAGNRFTCQEVLTLFASPNSTKKQSSADRRSRIVRIAVIAGLYAALTLVCMLFLGGLAWGPVQFRLSEAITVLALFTPEAIPGLALGCAIANLVNLAISGLGTLGLLDVVFGTLATALGAYFTWRFRERPAFAVLGPVIANALIVPAYLPLLLQGMGFYTIPFTSISLDGAYLPMYLFGLVATGLGEAVVLYVLGLPLAHSLAGSSLPESFRGTSGPSEA